jgi:hypothetical protein
MASGRQQGLGAQALRKMQFWFAIGSRRRGARSKSQVASREIYDFMTVPRSCSW